MFHGIQLVSDTKEDGPFITEINYLYVVRKGTYVYTYYVHYPTCIPGNKYTFHVCYKFQKHLRVITLKYSESVIERNRSDIPTPYINA